MDQQLQEKFRASLIEDYQKRGWESLANYEFFGKKYKVFDDQMKEWDSRIETAKKTIAEIKASPGGHTGDSRKAIAGLNQDIDMYQKRIASASETAKKLFEKTAGWREQGSQYLEIADTMLAFKLLTPKEIEARKKEDAAKPSEGTLQEADNK